MPNTKMYIVIMLTLLSLNAKGLISQEKQLSLQEYAKNLNSTILFLQETNLDSNTPLVSQEFAFFCNPPVQPSSGVAIAIKQSLLQEIKILEQFSPVCGYLQIIKAAIKNSVCHLVNVYMPHQKTTSDMVINQINQYLTTIKDEEIVVMAGDWNTTLKAEDRKNCSELRPQLSNQLEVLLHQFSLTDVWRHQNPDKQQFTYRGLHQNCPMARLDRIYIKNKDMYMIKSTLITPSFSDHDGVTMQINILKIDNKSPYWKLDSTLLNSNEYVQIIKNIISFYHKKSQEESINIAQLWDRLKEEISLASQRFTSKLRQETQEKLKILISQINHIEDKQDFSRNDSKLLLQLREEISSLYKTSANEKLKFLESQVINEANTQSKFFLRMAKQSKPSATISQLSINGQITTDKNLIFPKIQQYFQNEFSGENESQEINTSSTLYQNLPSLSHHDSQKCEEPITEEEIKDSITSAQPNSAPGMDGIPTYFYKFFWKEIKFLFTKLLQNFQQTGLLPASMKKVVITPIPKEGDRSLLSNWRPISLINTDYKITSRIFSKRISSVVSTLLSSDQSYCVPGRTIYNNLHLVRNIIRSANRSNSKLAILALDQSGAFNKISHKYLMHLLNIHNFGPNLRRCISSLLSENKGFVKIASSLLAPFVFKKGVLQGDPIAGPLYIISMEPFLRIASKMMASSGYPIPNTTSVVKSTAFADDVHFFITQNEDFDKIKEAFKVYSEQSKAQLNNKKSKVLFCGQWKSRTDTPLECQCNVNGLKVLGVFLGNTTEWELENWKTLLIKIKATLNLWSQHLKLTSYHGRKIICNQLAGSQLIHTLNILNPPKEFVQEVQRAMNNFIWQGKHWLHQNYLYAAVEVGGIGLTHLEAKIKSLRLKLAYDIQCNYNSEEPVILFHHYNMSLLGTSTPQNFFLKKRNPIDMINLEKFYLSVYNAWLDIKPTLTTEIFSLQVLRETPLQGSVIVDSTKIQISPEWNHIGVVSLGQLLNQERKWINLIFENNISAPTQRRLSNNYIQIKNYFDKKISPDNNLQISFKFLTQPSNEEKPFPGTRKQRYEASLHNYLTKPEITGKTTWSDKKITWSSIFQHPIDRRDSNTTWRLLHNALVTPRRLNQWKILLSESCLWCTQEVGNLTHMFFQCPLTKPLWNFVSIKIAAINESPLPTYEQLLLGYPGNQPPSRLSNFLLVLARSTIYRCYMNVIKDENPPAPSYLKMFKLRLKYRITLEEHYANLTRTQEKFKQTFLIKNALTQL